MAATRQRELADLPGMGPRARRSLRRLPLQQPEALRVVVHEFVDQFADIGRLAPSPTGAQHVGNASTYLIAWLSARSRGGQVVLRIEDIDSPRVKAGAAEEAYADLRWLGLDWDGDPIVQTRRLEQYDAALERLKAQELVYPCTCSRADIKRAASAPHLDHEGPVYPGTCAGRRAADSVNLTQPFACRFRVPEQPVSFADGFRGTAIGSSRSSPTAESSAIAPT